MNNNNPYSVPSLKMTQVADPIDPGFTYPDTDVVIPSPDDEIDPDFSVKMCIRDSRINRAKGHCPLVLRKMSLCFVVFFL